MPPFEKAVEDKVALVMTSFNTIDGMPMSGHKELLKKHLRETIGFQGIIISDWNSIEEMVHHRVAQNRKEAAALAIDATVDIDMMSFSYHKNLQELI
ncbi:MAG TPA: glycoside hydrolase family 3 N-terminal domain-containing protein, partial [Erysipelothrix sp.]